MRESVFYSLIFMLYCICCDLHRAVSLQQCARDNSRLVRDFVQNELSSLYADYGVSIPYSCQLSSERDMYNDQENHLNEESPSRWTCEYCGKSFYALHYLDLHFDNRHADKIRQTSDVTCLADYCDILRCDVLGATKQPEYWTMALCKESRLVKLKHKCQDYLKSCIPDSLKGTEELDKFKDALHAKTCEFLTCERYWEIVRSSDTHNAKIPYIIAGIFMVFATILYYVAAYTHFYTDEPVLETLGISDGRRRVRSRADSGNGILYAPCVQRQRTSFDYDDYSSYDYDDEGDYDGQYD